MPEINGDAEKAITSGATDPGAPKPAAVNSAPQASGSSAPPTKPAGETAEPNSGDDTPTFSQRKVNSIIRKQREQWEQEAQARAEEARAQEQRRQQEEAGNFRTLYEAVKAQADSLKAERDAEKAQAQKLRELLEGQIETETAEWPDEVKATDPAQLSDSYTLEQRLKWLAKTKPLAVRLGALTPAPGNGPSPAPAGTRGGPAEQEQARQAYAQKVRAENPLGF